MQIGEKEMSGQLFRKKSLDRVSSPEQLNDYIRVSSPSVWTVLTAVIIFLVGVCVWGIFGHIDTVVKAAGECRDGVVTCYVKVSDISAVQTGMEITVDGKQGTVTDMEAVPVEVTGDMDSYALYLGGLAEGDWVYVIKAQAPVGDGVYEVQIRVESVSPMSFILN